MRITICLLFAMVLNIHANVFSQATKLTLNLQNATVKEVFTEIERSSGYRFLYRNEFVNENQVVSISANDESLDQIMSKLFNSGDIAYKVFEGNIVVVTNKAMQQTKVSGTLADAITGELLPGVNVMVKGTTRGTTSDIDGKYTIEVNPGEILLFSYIGYLSEEISITNQSLLDLKLTPDIKQIEEIVVVGYGTQKKGTLTGSISNVAGKEIAKSPSSNLSSSLVGKLPGLTVNQRNGEPGRDDPNILIRGRGTLSSDPNKNNDVAAPLIIIDGVERSLMSRLNPDEIESVSVLKDASAAIYGARAANGVILITTKKGAKGKPVFNFTYNYAFSSPTKIPDMMDAATYAQVFNEASAAT